MTDQNRKKSFWSTLPGILTGLAAVITAITGLYLAFRDSPQKDSLAVLESVIGDYDCSTDSEILPKCKIYPTPEEKLEIAFVGPTHSDPNLIDRYRGLLVRTSNGFIAEITNEFRADPSKDISTSKSQIKLSRFDSSKFTGIWELSDGTSRPFEMVKSGNGS